MSNNDSKKISYYNTLIFTIISAIVSVLLLLVLLLKSGRDYLPFIITLEIGIFSIITFCVIQIIMGERNSEKNKQNEISKISFNTCPDYYLKKYNGDKELCSNEYIVKKGGINYIMKIYPADDPSNPTGGIRPLPSAHTFNYQGNEVKYEKFHLSEIDNENRLKTMSDKCSVLYNEPSNPELSYMKGYNLTPWTTMRSKCASTLN